MATAARVRQLMTELESLVDRIQVVSELEENQWGILFDDESQLGVEFHLGSSRECPFAACMFMRKHA